jgi:hypothetical protein
VLAPVVSGSPRFGSEVIKFKELTPMAERKIPPTERITASFKELALVSPDVESAAADLAKSISNLESYLRRIGIQVSAWHEIAGNNDGFGPYWSRDIGWSNINNMWSIAVRKTSGHNAFDAYEEEVWTFDNAPRWMAMEAVSKLPDLFETLIKRSKETTEKLIARKKDADELAAAIEAILPEIDEQRKLKKGKK